MILHVALNGRAENNGLDAEHALPSIEAAYGTISLARESGMLDGASVILVHAGEYVLPRALCFTEDIPVEIRPFENDKVVLSGGLELKDWKKVKVNGKTAYRAAVPEEITEVPYFFVNGKMMQQARFPKKKLFRTANDLDKFGASPEECDNFLMQEDVFNEKWYDPENIFVQITRLWVQSVHPVESCDRAAKKLILGTSMRYYPAKKDTEYCFLNVREALSEPGEYYFDRLRHEILLIPEDSKPFRAFLPALDELVRFSGARWITLRNLTFMHGGSHMPETGEYFDLRKSPLLPPVRNNISSKPPNLPKKVFCAGQGESHLPAAILFANARDCVIDNCEITNCSWYGIDVGTGCRNIRIENTAIHEMGGGGIRIGGPGMGSPELSAETETSRITVRKCHLHDLGKIHFSAIGILLTHAWGCLLEKNHIHDLFYSGISAGWTWGFAPALTREIRIIGNHIHHLGKGVLSDMGGIYTLGTQPGTQICGNVIHDIVNRYYGGWGIYPDEGSSDLVIEHNVVYDCACEPFHQHYGRDNMVRFNVFAFGKENGFASTAHRTLGYTAPGDLSTKDVMMFHNVILTDGVPPMRYVLQTFVDEGFMLSDHNFFYDISKAKKKLPFIKIDLGDVKEYSLKDWQDRFGNDRHSFFGKDPGFVNAAKRDFRLKKNSILRDYGFSDPEL